MEDDIPADFVSLFCEKLLNINQWDFDYVKRERNLISWPVVQDGHQWGFKTD